MEIGVIEAYKNYVNLRYRHWPERAWHEQWDGKLIKAAEKLLDANILVDHIERTGCFHILPGSWTVEHIEALLGKGVVRDVVWLRFSKRYRVILNTDVLGMRFPIGSLTKVRRV